MTDITPEVLSEIRNQKRSRGRPKGIDRIIKEMREKALSKQQQQIEEGEEEEESYFDLPFIPPRKKVARKKDLSELLPFIPGKDSWTIPRIPLKRKNPVPKPAESENVSESIEIQESDPVHESTPEENEITWEEIPKKKKSKTSSSPGSEMEPTPNPEKIIAPTEPEKVHTSKPQKVSSPVDVEKVPKPEKDSDIKERKETDDDEETLDSVSDISVKKERSFAVLLPKNSFTALNLCEDCFNRLKEDKSRPILRFRQ